MNSQGPRLDYLQMGGVVGLHTTFWYDDELQLAKIMGGKEQMKSCSSTNRSVDQPTAQ